MTNIIRRLEIVEKEVGGNSVVPENERIIVIPYRADQEQEFDRLTRQAIDGLKLKYGSNVSEDDLLVIGIKKYSREQFLPDDAKPRAGGR